MHRTCFCRHYAQRAFAWLRVEQDAAAYVSFLSVFATELHGAGFRVSVDVASWSPFWDFDAIAAKTAVDTLITMDTYTSNFTRFQAVFQARQPALLLLLYCMCVCDCVRSAASCYVYPLTSRRPSSTRQGTTAAWHASVSGCAHRRAVAVRTRSTSVSSWSSLHTTACKRWTSGRCPCLATGIRCFEFGAELQPRQCTVIPYAQRQGRRTTTRHGHSERTTQYHSY